MRHLTTMLCALILSGAHAPAFAQDAERASPTNAAAAGSAEAEAPQNPLFDQLVGAWDVRYEIFDADGRVRRYRGQVRYDWILAGRALQEIWSSDSHSADPRPFGTTINFYDPKRERWTAVWVYPEQGMTTIVAGGQTDAGFVLTGPDESGAIQRWITTLTEPDTIEGRFELSSDAGATWRLVGLNHMARRRP